MRKPCPFPCRWLLVPGLALPGLLPSLAQAEECFRTLTPVTSFAGHRDKIRPVAISPDGKTVASGDGAGEVRLWDVVGGKLRRAVRAATPGHTAPSPVAGLDFSSDGKLLLIGRGDGTLQVGGTATNAPPRVYGEGRAAALSPRGELLRSGEGQLVSPLSGKPLRSLAPIEGESLAFSPDGGRIAVGRGRLLELRSAQDGTLIGSVPPVTPAATATATTPAAPREGPAATIDRVRFSPDGIWLAAASQATGTTQIYTLADPSQPRLVRSLNTTQFAFLPDARLAYADPISPSEGRVSIIELPHSPWKTCLVAPTTAADPGFAPAALAANPAGQWLTASDPARGRVHVWNLKAMTAPPEPVPVEAEEY